MMDYDYETIKQIGLVLNVKVGRGWKRKTSRRKTESPQESRRKEIFPVVFDRRSFGS